MYMQRHVQLSAPVRFIRSGPEMPVCIFLKSIYQLKSLIFISLLMIFCSRATMAHLNQLMTTKIKLMTLQTYLIIIYNTNLSH